MPRTQKSVYVDVKRYIAGSDWFGRYSSSNRVKLSVERFLHYYGPEFEAESFGIDVVYDLHNLVWANYEYTVQGKQQAAVTTLPVRLVPGEIEQWEDFNKYEHLLNMTSMSIVNGYLATDKVIEETTTNRKVIDARGQRSPVQTDYVELMARKFIAYVNKDGISYSTIASVTWGMFKAARTADQPGFRIGTMGVPLVMMLMQVGPRLITDVSRTAPLWLREGTHDSATWVANSRGGSALLGTASTMQSTVSNIRGAKAAMTLAPTTLRLGAAMLYGGGGGLGVPSVDTVIVTVDSLVKLYNSIHRVAKEGLFKTTWTEEDTARMVGSSGDFVAFNVAVMFDGYSIYQDARYLQRTYRGMQKHLSDKAWEEKRAKRRAKQAQEAATREAEEGRDLEMGQIEMGEAHLNGDLAVWDEDNQQWVKAEIEIVHAGGTLPEDRANLPQQEVLRRVHLTDKPIFDNLPNARDMQPPPFGMLRKAQYDAESNRWFLVLEKDETIPKPSYDRQGPRLLREARAIRKRENNRNIRENSGRPDIRAQEFKRDVPLVKRSISANLARERALETAVQKLLVSFNEASFDWDNAPSMEQMLGPIPAPRASALRNFFEPYSIDEKATLFARDIISQLEQGDFQAVQSVIFQAVENNIATSHFRPKGGPRMADFGLGGTSRLFVTQVVRVTVPDLQSAVVDDSPIIFGDIFQGLMLSASDEPFPGECPHSLTRDMLENYARSTYPLASTQMFPPGTTETSLLPTQCISESFFIETMATVRALEEFTTSPGDNWDPTSVSLFQKTEDQIAFELVVVEAAKSTDRLIHLSNMVGRVLVDRAVTYQRLVTGSIAEALQYTFGDEDLSLVEFKPMYLRRLERGDELLFGDIDRFGHFLLQRLGYIDQYNIVQRPLPRGPDGSLQVRTLVEAAMELFKNEDADMLSKLDSDLWAQEGHIPGTIMRWFSSQPEEVQSFVKDGAETLRDITSAPTTTPAPVETTAPTPAPATSAPTTTPAPIVTAAPTTPAPVVTSAPTPLPSLVRPSVEPVLTFETQNSVEFGSVTFGQHENDFSGFNGYFKMGPTNSMYMGSSIPPDTAEVIPQVRMTLDDEPPDLDEQKNEQWEVILEDEAENPSTMPESEDTVIHIPDPSEEKKKTPISIVADSFTAQETETFEMLMKSRFPHEGLTGDQASTLITSAPTSSSGAGTPTPSTLITTTPTVGDTLAPSTLTTTTPTDDALTPAPSTLITTAPTDDALTPAPSTLITTAPTTPAPSTLITIAPTMGGAGKGKGGGGGADDSDDSDSDPGDADDEDSRGFWWEDFTIFPEFPSYSVGTSSSMEQEETKALSTLASFFASAGSEQVLEEQESTRSIRLKTSNLLMGMTPTNPTGTPLTNPILLSQLATHGLRYSGDLDPTVKYYQGGTLTEGDRPQGTVRKRGYAPVPFLPTYPSRH